MKQTRHCCGGRRRRRTCGLAGRRHGPGLSDQADHRDRAVRGRRPDRCAGPRAVPAHGRGARPAARSSRMSAAPAARSASTRSRKAAPDGYTLLFTHMGTLAVNIALYKSLPYDSLKDLEPIGLGGTNPDGAGRQEGPAGQDLRRVHGLREGQPEEGAVRHGRHRRGLASRRPDAEQHDEGRCAGDPLQGHRSGAERSRLPASSTTWSTRR